MKKRGQVSLFVVIGVLIVLAIILFFSFKDFIISKISTEGTSPVDINKQLESKMNAVSGKISECATKESEDALGLLLKQGGYIEILRYKMFYGDKVAVLCAKYADEKSCFNSVPSRKAVEESINKYIELRLGECVKISSFKTSDIDVRSEGYNINSSLSSKNVAIKIHYPISVSKGTQKFSKDEFVIVVDSPLGLFLDVANDIAGSYAAYGNFDVIAYAADNPGLIIQPVNLGSDVFYSVSDYYEKNSFVFGVEK